MAFYAGDRLTGTTGGGGGGNLFESDFAAASPYNFSAAWVAQEGVYFTTAAHATGGPSNRAYVEINFITTAVHAQPNSGWEKTGLTAPAQGGARYVRYRQFVNTGFNASGNNGPWGNKAWMIGDTTGVDSERIIMQNRVRTGLSDYKLNCEKNIDFTMTPFELTQGAWHSVQVEVQSSTTTTSGDGWIKMWVDVDTYGSHSGISSGLSLDVSGWTNFRFGSFFNETTVASGGSVGVRFAQVQYDDAFDASWHASL